MLTHIELNRKLVSTLEKPEFLSILLEIMGDRDYASQIARDLDKTQPTITEELNLLESLGIVQVAKRTKAKKYRVNVEVLVEAVYSMIEEFRDHWLEVDTLGIIPEKRLEKLGKKSIENTVPEELLRDFFDNYAVGIVGVIPGEVRGFGDIIRSFFGALDALNDEEYGRLLSAYNLKKSTFSLIVRFMSFDTINRARASILSSIDLKEKLADKLPQKKNADSRRT